MVDRGALTIFRRNIPVSLTFVSISPLAQYLKFLPHRFSTLDKNKARRSLTHPPS